VNSSPCWGSQKYIQPNKIGWLVNIYNISAQGDLPMDLGSSPFLLFFLPSLKIVFSSESQKIAISKSDLLSGDFFYMNEIIGIAISVL
jgi:hypothetical protein